jgi:hypothetical protein
MAISKDDELEESSEVTTIDETTPVASRVQSSYSTQRTKLLIAPTKYGESRAQYLWRLLRCSIRRTIDAVSRADDTGRRCNDKVSQLRMKILSLLNKTKLLFCLI